MLCFFLGGFGGHWLYLERTRRGLIYLIFFWTFIPALIAPIEFIYLLVIGKNEFDRNYNPPAATN